MKREIDKYISECDTCQRVKASHLKVAGLRFTSTVAYPIVEMGRHKYGFHCWIAKHIPEARFLLGYRG